VGFQGGSGRNLLTQQNREKEERNFLWKKKGDSSQPDLDNETKTKKQSKKGVTQYTIGEEKKGGKKEHVGKEGKRQFGKKKVTPKGKK